jgi:hypothetical protein
VGNTPAFCSVRKWKIEKGFITLSNNLGFNDGDTNMLVKKWMIKTKQNAYWQNASCQKILCLIKSEIKTNGEHSKKTLRCNQNYW